MRNGFLGSLAALAVSASVAFGQQAGVPAAYPLWPGDAPPPAAEMPAPLPSAVTVVTPAVVPAPAPAEKAGGRGLLKAGLFSRASRQSEVATETIAPPVAAAPATPAPAASAQAAPALPPGMPAVPMPPGMPYGGDPWAGISGPPGGPSFDAPCPKGECFFGDAEYLIWAMRRAPNIGPLVTTGAPTLGGQVVPPNGPDQLIVTPTTAQNFGFLDNPSVSGVIGTGPINLNAFSGVRATIGAWKGDDRRWGWSLSGYVLEDKTNLQQIASDPTGIPVIVRPFTNVFNNEPSGLLVAYPGLAAGTAQVAADAMSWSAEANGLLNLYRTCNPGCMNRTLCDCLVKWNMLFGLRYFELDERLAITTNSVLHSGRIIPVGNLSFTGPLRYAVNDSFDTRNSFYGGQIGTEMEFQHGRWSLNILGKFAAGYMYESVRIDGSTSLYRGAGAGSAPGIFRGGLYALPSNIGKYDTDEFAVIPEGNFRIGYMLTKNLQAFAGYTFIYVDKVARPGSQITPVLNPNQIPLSATYGTPFGPVAPVMPFRQDAFWLQGASFGLALTF